MIYLTKRRPYFRQQRVHFQPAPWTSQVGAMLFVYNPRASNYRRAERWAEGIAVKLGLQTVHINMIDGMPALLRQIQTLPTKQMGLIAIGGGDGTVNSIVNLLLHELSSRDRRRLFVLPLWGGNANDFSYMLNGLSSRQTVTSYLPRRHRYTYYFSQYKPMLKSYLLIL